MRKPDNSQSWIASFLLLTLATWCLFINTDTNARARRSAFPRGCQASGYHFTDGKLVINPDNADPHQTLYLIHNKSDTRVHVEYQKDPNAFMSPTWEADLDRNRWAAFATDKSNIPFKCKRKSRYEETDTDCGEALALCQYPRAKFALANMGNY